ncbi:conserved exported hypothetical protein [Candidatus Desulfosporosinus infrequens]|uniref:SCP domain-containing protein n=1 Tax=Candidatus Desulfosporosinus infrequens TaxID=2043169 RepID=A0A2U3L5R5_9FIRM|nr:conserved exported hypothetical protein [Candidatus Desulfosporosinus infrequens]
MKTLKILAASVSMIAVLAAPAQAGVNIAPSQLSGSVVKIQPSMIHTPTQRSSVVSISTSQWNSVVSVPTTAPTLAQGSNEVSLKGIIPPQAVSVPAATPNPDDIGVYSSPVNQKIVMPQIPAATDLTASEQQMVDEINQARAAAGVDPVKVDLRLVTAARIKAEDLYLNHYFSHVSPNFGYTASLLPGLGLNVGYWSENVGGNDSVGGAMAAFMSSIGHRVNILDPNVNYVGVGVLEGISPYNLYVQEFVHE